MATTCTMCPDWTIKFPERCSNTLERKSETLYFCTARCKERFLRREAEPTRPIKKGTTKKV